MRKSILKKLLLKTLIILIITISLATQMALETKAASKEEVLLEGHSFHMPSTYNHSNSSSAYFTDVPTSHWAAKYIYSLVEDGIIKGKTPTLFAPQDKITRAELTVLLFRLSGEKAPSTKVHFDDVANTAWFAQELSWAIEAGIIESEGQKRFSPQQAVNRQDMAVMLFRYLIGRGFAQPPRERLHRFSDEESISAYAAEAVSALQLAELITGYEDGSFRPQGSISRAEAAKLLVLIKQSYFF